MFSTIPKLLLPITQYSSFEESLVGKVIFEQNSRQVRGVDTKFTIQCTVGSEIFNNDVSLGFIDEIIDDEHLTLDEPAEDDVVTTTAIIKLFDPSKLGTPILITDIFRRVVASEQYAQRSSVLMPYRIVEAETPEMISMKFYRTPFYHWIILLLNNIVDPREEWPLSEELLQEKIMIQYSTKLTGTVSTTKNDNVVKGTNTLFTSELKVGDYLLTDKSNKRLGQVEIIVSDTVLRLTHPISFTSEDIKYKYINNNDILFYREVDTQLIVDCDSERLAMNEIEGVTIYNHEVQINENKRLIKIIKPSFLTEFITQYRNLINQTT